MKVTRRIITALTVMAMTILPATSHAQGYYYDKPLPKEEFEARLVTKQYNK